MFCPNCKCGYVEGIMQCSDCNAQLVKDLPKKKLSCENQKVKSLGDPRIIFVSGDIHEANLVKGLLESHGVHVFLKDEFISKMLPQRAKPAYGIPVKLIVGEKQMELASRLIKEYRGKSDDTAYFGKTTPWEEA